LFKTDIIKIRNGILFAVLGFAYPISAVALERDEVRVVQSLLSAEGYPVGAIDGTIGQKSKSAAKQYLLKMGVLPGQEPLATLLTTIEAVSPKDPRGVWSGSYECAQVNIPLTVTIYESSKELKAILEFGDYSGKGRTWGVYSSKVVVDSDGFEIKFVPDKWIEEPPGYVPVVINTRLSPDGGVLDGKIEHSNCGRVAVERSVVAQQQDLVVSENEKSTAPPTEAQEALKEPIITPEAAQPPKIKDVASFQPTIPAEPVRVPAFTAFLSSKTLTEANFSGALNNVTITVCFTQESGDISQIAESYGAIVEDAELIDDLDELADTLISDYCNFVPFSKELDERLKSKLLERRIAMDYDSPASLLTFYGDRTQSLKPTNYLKEFNPRAFHFENAAIATENAGKNRLLTRSCRLEADYYRDSFFDCTCSHNNPSFQLSGCLSQYFVSGLKYSSAKVIIEGALFIDPYLNKAPKNLNNNELLTWIEERVDCISYLLLEEAKITPPKSEKSPTRENRVSIFNSIGGADKAIEDYSKQCIEGL
jgi:hypothetical protein